MVRGDLNMKGGGSGLLLYYIRACAIDLLAILNLLSVRS